MWTVKYMEMDARRLVDSATMAKRMTLTPAVLIITLTVLRLLPITGVQYIKKNAVKAVRKLWKKKIQTARMKPLVVTNTNLSCAGNIPKNARKLVDSATRVVLMTRNTGGQTGGQIGGQIGGQTGDQTGDHMVIRVTGPEDWQSLDNWIMAIWIKIIA
jgi:hypothetical protein